jgi:hypothetical protein
MVFIASFKDDYVVAGTAMYWMVATTFLALLTPENFP